MQCLFVCLFVTEEILCIFEQELTALIYVDDGKYYTVSWLASNQGNYAKAPKLHSALCSNTVKIGAGKSSRKEEERV